MREKLLSSNTQFAISAGTDEFGPEIIRDDTLLVCRKRSPLPGDFVIYVKDGQTNLHKFKTAYQEGTFAGVVCESLRAYR